MNAVGYHWGSGPQQEPQRFRALVDHVRPKVLHLQCHGYAYTPVLKSKRHVALVTGLSMRLRRSRFLSCVMGSRSTSLAKQDGRGLPFGIDIEAKLLLQLVACTGKTREHFVHSGSFSPTSGRCSFLKPTHVETSTTNTSADSFDEGQKKPNNQPESWTRTFRIPQEKRVQAL